MFSYLQINRYTTIFVDLFLDESKVRLRKQFVIKLMKQLISSKQND